MFDSSLRHQVNKGNPAIEKVAGFFFSASQAQWSPDFGAMGRKKPRPVMGGVGAPPAPPNGQTPGAKRCLLGGFGSSSGSGRSSLGCSRCRSGSGGIGCSSRSSLHSGSGRCCRSGGSGGSGSRSGRRLFLLATGSQSGCSDQGSDDEGLVHFRFSLRRVKKTKAKKSSLFQPAHFSDQHLAFGKRAIKTAVDCISNSSIVNNTNPRMP